MVSAVSGGSSDDGSERPGHRRYRCAETEAPLLPWRVRTLTAYLGVDGEPFPRASDRGAPCSEPGHCQLTGDQPRTEPHQAVGPHSPTVHRMRRPVHQHAVHEQHRNVEGRGQPPHRWRRRPPEVPRAGKQATAIATMAIERWQSRRRRPGPACTDVSCDAVAIPGGALGLVFIWRKGDRSGTPTSPHGLWAPAAEADRTPGRLSSA